jgi:hypothetical protein
MSQRLAPSELCDLARSGNVVVRALAHEVLAQAPTFLLAALLHDPVDADVARAVLERQAQEFGLEDASACFAKLTNSATKPLPQDRRRLREINPTR